MRRYIILRVLFLLGLTSTSRLVAAAAPPLANDASIRLKQVEAVDALLYNIVRDHTRGAHTSAIQLNDDQIAILVRGATDPAEVVRFAAIRGLSLMSFVGEAAGANAHVPRLVHLPSAKLALEKAMEDPNHAVRAAAILVYARSFTLTPELESKWITAFNSEPSDEAREALVCAIVRNAAHSSAALAFGVDQLRNPKLAYQTAQCLLSYVNPPPSQILPILVAEFSHSSDPGKRDLLARSVANFGVSAKQFIPTVQEMWARERDPAVKRNLQRAVERLQAL